MVYTQASRDLRERALAALDAGRTVGEVAAVIGMDPSSVRRWRRLHDRTGRSAPLPHPGPAFRLGLADLDALRADVIAHPDDTLAQRRARWADRTGTRLSLSTLSRALRRLGMTFKQRRCLPGNGTRRNAPRGPSASPVSPPSASSGWTSAVCQPDWCRDVAGNRRGSASSAGSRGAGGTPARCWRP